RPLHAPAPFPDGLAVRGLKGPDSLPVENGLEALPVPEARARRCETHLFEDLGAAEEAPDETVREPAMRQVARGPAAVEQPQLSTRCRGEVQPLEVDRIAGPEQKLLETPLDREVPAEVHDQQTTVDRLGAD